METVNDYHRADRHTYNRLTTAAAGELPDFACAPVMCKVVAAAVHVNVSCDRAHQMRHALWLSAVIIVILTCETEKSRYSPKEDASYVRS